MDPKAVGPDSSNTARRARPPKPPATVSTRVIARIQPQGEEGLRWVHLTLARGYGTCLLPKQPKD